jgi:intracellular septation protein A
MTTQTLTRPARRPLRVAALLPVPAADGPGLASILGRLAVSLSVACVAPAVLFYLTLIAFDVSVAVLVALGWSYAAIGWRWATKRRPSGLLALLVSVMTVRTAVTLMSGNTFIYFFQPVLSDVAIAAVFLVSLATARPIVSRLAGDFYPMTLDIAARPRIQNLFWRLTLMWGLMVLAKGVVSLWLLESQSLVTFVLLKNISMIAMTLLTVTATVSAAVIVARKEGLLPAT